MSTFLNSLPITVVLLADEVTPSLEKCLRSVAWASEVLILDSKHQIKNSNYSHWHQRIRIISIDPITNFSTARNEGLKHATTDWVFFIDSDEWLECEVTDISTQLAKVRQTGAKAARIRRVDIFYGKQLQWGEVRDQWPIRLMRKDAALFHGNVHEKAEIKGTIADLSMKLYHQPHLSITAFMQSVDEYSQLAAAAKTTPFSRLEIVMWPIGKWLNNVIIKCAWLDGWRGIIYATIMSWHSWLVRCYWYARTTS